MKTLSLGVAAALLAAAVPVAAEDAVTQARFIEAIELIDKGRADLAVLILEQLHSEMPTPRIRLERARALMLTGRLEPARNLFVEAFKDDPPPTVKANILAFVSRIDRLRGKLTVGAGVARYNNPLQQPGVYTLNFGGIELTYEADERYRNQWGVTLSGSYVKEFAGDWIVRASGSWRDLPLDRADQVGIDASVSRQLTSPPLEVRVGATRLVQKDQSFTLPYGQLTYSVPLGPKLGLKPSITAGYYAADAGEGASGLQVDAFVPLVFAPSPTRSIAIGPNYLRRDTPFKEQAFSAVALRAMASAQSDLVNLDAGIQASITQFGGVDPFFGKKRRDQRLYGSLAVSSFKLRLGPFVPAFGISCDIARSNIAYFERSGCDTAFEVRKIF